ncbi:PREDICTED: heavy metal-associated isoprenylated plant protein 26-like [Nelumbo nucifera]|uniref:Heavy metal-associated isoprenylated plant protein 26-like n=2 Tax=Nelumbo nucifera TaxID=4432 RepID=A0A1U8BB16_NELNU|nr:PREDICTED: heavy metal-associated isoprenylated plant protein 26-like [Nelumbo nucifera]DAD24930.1 TPA_asm: hypothetical protein HUJ06_026394 [Nelumbo nucifera]
MSTKKIDLKVNMNCLKCKKQVLQSITKLQGIDSITVDMEKGIVSVIGDVDPIQIVCRVRKTGRIAELTNVGPPKKPEDPKKPDDKPKPNPDPIPHCCKDCQHSGFSLLVIDDGRPSCSIL